MFDPFKTIYVRNRRRRIPIGELGCPPRCRHGRARGCQSRGYILLMVLVLLIIMATALTSMAARSLQTTQQATIAVARLQQRIGMASCQKALLSKASDIFKTLDALRRDGRGPSLQEPRHIVADSVALGDQRFDLVLSDENAKVNLNTMFHLAGKFKLEQLLRTKLSIEDYRAMLLRPALASNSERSARSQTTTTSKSNESKASNTDSGDSGGEATTPLAGIQAPPAFRSWGEVFDLGFVVKQSPDQKMRIEFAKSFTLWGSGQINIDRATDDLVTTLVESVLGPAETKTVVLKLRESDDSDIQTIIEQNVTLPRLRPTVRALLGQHSFAFSLFVDGTAPQCRSRKLFVEAVDINGTQQLSEFVFH